MQNLRKTFGKRSIYQMFPENLINNNHNNYNEMGNKILNTIKGFAAVGTVDPERDEKQVFKVLLIGERAGVSISAVFSGLAFAAWGWNFAGNLWDNDIFQGVIALVILITSTYLTDVAIKFIFQKCAYDFFLFFKFHWVKDLTAQMFIRFMQFVSFWGLIAVGASMFALDLFSIDAVKTAVADVVRQDTLINQTAEVAKVDGQEAARVGATLVAIEAAKIDLKNYDAQIEQERRRIASGYDKGIELYEKKNAWFFQKKLNPAFAKSSRLKQLNAQVDETHANLSALNKQKVQDIAMRSDRVNQTSASIAAINSATSTANQERQLGAKNMTMYLGVGSKAVAIAIRILLVALFLALSNKDVNNDGKVDRTDVDEAAKQGFRPA